MADDAKPVKKPAAGWYVHPDTPDRKRRWDGETWLDEWQLSTAEAADRKRRVRARNGPDLAGFWAIGVVGALVGGGLLTNPSSAGIGIFLLVGSGIVLQVGVVAFGVSLGMRHRDAWNRKYGL